MSADLESHANRIATLLSELEEAPDSEVKLTAFELLENVDHLHRSCVWRLFELMTDLGGKGLVDPLGQRPGGQDAVCPLRLDSEPTPSSRPERGGGARP